MKPRSFLRSLLSGAVAALALLLVLAANLNWQPRRDGPPEGRPALDAPYVATVETVVERMLAMARIGPRDHVIDLGCGDGRILVAAARARGASGYGVDLDPARIREAEANARRAGVAERVRFEARDLFETPIRGATVIAIYLLPEINLQLRPRFLSELRPGTRIVSHGFDMGDWPPDRTESVGGAQLFLWIVPARVAGRWSLTDEQGRTARIAIAQRYQAIAGDVAEARLAGDRLAFVADLGSGARTFEGRVAGDRIEPLDPAAGWRMERSH
jgi:SAM-dependent methyltransferase